MGRHQIDRRFLAIELLPYDRRAMRSRNDVWPGGISIGPADRKWIGKRPALVLRAGVEKPLAHLAIGVPGHVIGTCRRDRQTGSMMGAGGNLPVILADATHLARCRRI